MLKDNVLTYHESDQEGSKSLGTIDIRNAVYVDMFTGSYLDLSVAQAKKSIFGNLGGGHLHTLSMRNLHRSDTFVLNCNL